MSALAASPASAPPPRALQLPDEWIEVIAARAAALLVAQRPITRFMTIPEAAEYLRCKRQRIDDLLSQRRLSRYKEHGRTLLLRDEVEALAQIDRRARP